MRIVLGRFVRLREPLFSLPRPLIHVLFSSGLPYQRVNLFRKGRAKDLVA